MKQSVNFNGLNLDSNLKTKLNRDNSLSNIDLLIRSYSSFSVKSVI